MINRYVIQLILSKRRQNPPDAVQTRYSLLNQKNYQFKMINRYVIQLILSGMFWDKK